MLITEEVVCEIPDDHDKTLLMYVTSGRISLAGSTHDDVIALVREEIDCGRGELDGDGVYGSSSL